MKCPLLAIGKKYEVGAIYPKGADCLKEECAWWVHSDQRCSILIIAAHIIGLMACADVIINKMPHEEQFRR